MAAIITCKISDEGVVDVASRNTIEV